MLCTRCNREMEKGSADLTMANGRIVVRDLPSYECKECKRAVFDKKTVAMADEILTRYMQEDEDTVKFTRTVGFDGKNMILRIPKPIQQALRITRGDEVTIWIKDKNNVIINLK